MTEQMTLKISGEEFSFICLNLKVLLTASYISTHISIHVTTLFRQPDRQSKQSQLDSPTLKRRVSE